MAEERKDFCVVGLGGHARNKLIPALLAAGQGIAGVVTSGTDAAGTGAPVFSTLDAALAALPRKVVFLLATPPRLHFPQAKAVLESGRAVVVEKPAFVTRAETSEVLALSARTKGLVLEAFMHRYTRLYAELLATWAHDSHNIVAIETRFLIPETAGTATFRGQTDIGSSIVFDIGCYPVSLLADLGLGHVGLGIVEAHAAGDLGRERLRIAGSDGALTVDIGIGMAGAYENWVRFVYRDGTTKTFRPFFFGRPGEKSIVTIRDGEETVETFADANAFEIMLGLARTTWAQDSHTAGMVDVAEKLEDLGRELLLLRERSAA